MPKYGTIRQDNLSVLPTFYWAIEITGSLTGLSDLSTALQFRATSHELPPLQHDMIMVDAMRFTFPHLGIVSRNGQIAVQAYESNDAKLITSLYKAFDDMFDKESGVLKSGTNPNFEVKTKIFKDFNDEGGSPIMTIKFEHCVLAMLQLGGQLNTGAAVDYLKPDFAFAYGRHYKE